VGPAQLNLLPALDAWARVLCVWVAGTATWFAENLGGATLAGVRVLIVGASGLVGGVLWTELSRSHDVVGTCHGTEVPQLVPLDLQDEKALAAMGGTPS